MPIANSELVFYLSANRPINDVSTTGGAIDATMRPIAAHFAAPARVALVSDGADTRVATVRFRDVTGVIIQENVALNGVSEVLSVATAERVLSVVLDAVSPRTVLLKEGAGGTVRITIPPQELGAQILFYDSASESSGVNRVDKLHLKNNNLSLTLNNATVTLTADPVARIKIGIAATKNDSVTVANRKASPGGIVFVDDSVVVNVPTGNLASTEAAGTWIQQGLLANDPPFKSTFTVTGAGTSA